MSIMFDKHMKVYTTLQGTEDYITKGTCLAKLVPDDEYRMKMAVPRDAVKEDKDGLLTVCLPQE